MTDHNIIDQLHDVMLSAVSELQKDGVEVTVADLMDAVLHILVATSLEERPDGMPDDEVKAGVLRCVGECFDDYRTGTAAQVHYDA